MTEPSELATTPNVIPYVDPHSGPKRLLTIDIVPPRTVSANPALIPFASVDGRQYVVVWGSVSFEIPADRNVHVSVHCLANYTGHYQPTPYASIILYPNSAPERLAAQLTSSGMGAFVPVG